MTEQRWAFMRTLRIGPPEDRYLTRVRVVSTPLFGIYLHRLHRADAERHLHDHPWPFAALILRGGYVEDFSPDPRVFPGVRTVRRWRRGSLHRMPLYVAHRIAEVQPHTTTLVFVGRKTREWGFWTEDGWVAWQKYLTDEYGTDQADRSVTP